MKIACEACNTGWMKANVDAAIPVLTPMQYGYWGKLSDSDAMILARWIAQFSMSFEFADRQTVMIPQAVRTEFSKTNQLQGNWLIAAGVTGEHGNDLTLHRAFSLLSSDGKKFPAQITSIMFGQLFCLSFYAAFPIFPEVVEAIVGMRLSIIYPYPEKGVVRPSWPHTQESIDIVVDAVSAAVSAVVGKGMTARELEGWAR